MGIMGKLSKKKEQPTEVNAPVQEVKSEGENDEITMIYTLDQVIARIQKLEQSEDVALFLKTKQGENEYLELQELIAALPKKKQ